MLDNNGFGKKSRLFTINEDKNVLGKLHAPLWGAFTNENPYYFCKQSGFFSETIFVQQVSWFATTYTNINRIPSVVFEKKIYIYIYFVSNSHSTKNFDLFQIPTFGRNNSGMCKKRKKLSGVRLIKNIYIYFFFLKTIDDIRFMLV